MVRLLLKWLLYAFALLVTARLVPGFHVRSIAAALVAVLVIGLLNVTLGLLLKLITLPLGISDAGIVLPGDQRIHPETGGGTWFRDSIVATWGAALIGALVLALLHMLLSLLLDKD